MRTDALRRSADRIAVFGAAGCLALALVVPNHSPPWMSFVQELLAAMAFAWLAVIVLATERRAGEWMAPQLLVLGLLAVVAGQYSAGLIESKQTAWMHALYLLAALLAMHTGATLQRRAPRLVLALLWVPAMLAGVVSVGLQLHQWLVHQPGEGSLWVYRAVGGRPSANIGQANLLATLYVIAGIGACHLSHTRKRWAVWGLALLAVFMAGLAMTQSRTGFLNAGLVMVALWIWRWPDRRWRLAVPIFATLQLALFVAFMSAARATEQAISSEAVERLSAGLRPDAWRLFADALRDRWFFGYGWGQTFAAQLVVAPENPPLHRVFLSAHNLPLDLALWMGLPMALVVATAALVWLVFCARHAKDLSSRLLLLSVAVLAVHSMFEYPLNYAYFLLPAGLAVGALSQRIELAVLWRTPRWFVWCLLSVVLAATALTLRDYLRIEQAYRVLLMEKARIVVTEDRSPPDVLVLDSLRDLIVFSRTEPVAGMSDEQLQWMARVQRAHPGPHGFSRLAQALAMNGRPTEAQHWVDQLCRIHLPAQCLAQGQAWLEISDKHPALHVVRWP